MKCQHHRVMNQLPTDLVFPWRTKKKCAPPFGAFCSEPAMTFHILSKGVSCQPITGHPSPPPDPSAALAAIAFGLPLLSSDPTPTQPQTRTQANASTRGSAPHTQSAMEAVALSPSQWQIAWSGDMEARLPSMPTASSLWSLWSPADFGLRGDRGVMMRNTSP
mmetsp:Transcript_64264/g.129182  ORF Transcript_64264/g.129182 Transcript_64264/m.129182 type:complete len:163 (-) Transcript_64264:160-648(-)